MTDDRISGLFHSPITLVAVVSFGCYGMGRYQPPPPPQFEPPTMAPPADSTPQGRTGPSTPGAPRGATPATPGSGGRTPGRSAGRQRTATTLGIDGNAWTHWWTYNGSAFLLPRLNPLVPSPRETFARNRTSAGNKLVGVRPGPVDADAMALELRRILASRRSNVQMRAAALMALAKIRRGKLSDYVPALRDSIAEIRENCILAMGIAGVGADVLVEIAKDSNKAAALLGGHAPSYRERSFACFAAGTLASRSDDLEQKQTLLDEMIAKSLQKGERWDVRIAALHSLRLMQAPKLLWLARTKKVQELIELAMSPAKASSSQFVVHAWSALRAPLRKMGHERESVERRIVAALSDRRTPSVIRQALVQSLGFLSDDEDEDVIRALIQVSVQDKDLFTRQFAMMALGRVGGPRAQDHLLASFAAHRPHRGDYAWLALALATSCQRERPDGTLAWATPRPEIGAAIHKRFAKTRSRVPASGMAIALGLLRYEPAAEDIAERLDRWQKHDEPAGYLALSLALLKPRGATDRILKLLEDSRGREGLVVQASLALALLQDHRTERLMLDKLQSGESLPVLISMTTSLGRIGSRTSITELRKELADGDHPRWLMAVMIVAMGEIMVQKEIPWNARLSWGIHYRFSTPILTGHGSASDKV